MKYKGFIIDKDRGLWDILRTDVRCGGHVGSSSTRKSAKLRIDRFHNEGESFITKYCHYTLEQYTAHFNENVTPHLHKETRECPYCGAILTPAEDDCSCNDDHISDWATTPTIRPKMTEDDYKDMMGT